MPICQCQHSSHGVSRGSTVDLVYFKRRWQHHQQVATRSPQSNTNLIGVLTESRCVTVWTVGRNRAVHFTERHSICTSSHHAHKCQNTNHEHTLSKPSEPQDGPKSQILQMERMKFIFPGWVQREGRLVRWCGTAAAAAPCGTPCRLRPGTRGASRW